MQHKHTQPLRPRTVAEREQERERWVKSVTKYRREQAAKRAQQQERPR